MNLYLIYPVDNDGEREYRVYGVDYDCYIAAVVCAKSEADARRIHPLRMPGRIIDVGDPITGECWPVTVLRVGATYLGRAAKSLKRGVVLDSYKGG